MQKNTKVSMDTLRISSRDLTELLKKSKDYDMERSEEYDLILVPK